MEARFNEKVREFQDLIASRPDDARAIEAEILTTLRTMPANRGTIVALKGAIKDKAAKALTYDALTIHLGNMIARGEVTSAPGRHADFPEYWSI